MRPEGDELGKMKAEAVSDPSLCFLSLVPSLFLQPASTFTWPCSVASPSLTGPSSSTIYYSLCTLGGTCLAINQLAGWPWASHAKQRECAEKWHHKAR